MLCLINHPLEPLSVEEITAATAIARQHNVGQQLRFPIVVLNEPSKSIVLNFQQGPIEREAFLVLLDNATGNTYEAVVSLIQEKVVSWKHVPDVQPRIMADEVFECEAVVKANPQFQAALKKRGITNLELVMVDPWVPGYFGFEDEQGIRLSRSLCWLRASPTDNAYARPIDGLIPVVDLNKMEVLRVEDLGIVPIPPQPGNYAREFIPEFRSDLKPLDIVQPEGPSFTVQGHHVRWQKWQFRIGFNPREGLVLYTIGYEDQGRLRPIIYRASMAEMVVPYGDPRVQHFRKNAFDIGEIGIGALANSLSLGCDCLGEIHYFDAVITEEDIGVADLAHEVRVHHSGYGNFRLQDGYD